MPAPLKWRSKILLAKIETNYGVDSAPTGVANAILATEVQLTPMDGSDVSRDLELPYLGGQGTVPTELRARLTFRVELSPSGTAGTAPAWGVLLRGCAMAQVIAASTVTYSPVSDAHDSLTLHLWIENTRFVILGARGNCRLTVTAQGIPYLEFDFLGIFTQPAETARVTPTLTAFQAPQVASRVNTPTFTVNSVAFVLRSFSLDLGNAVEPRFLIGSDSVVITDRAEMMEFTVEAQPLTAFNPFSLAAAQTRVPVVLTHGVGAGRIATINAPLTQIQRPQGLSAAQNLVEWQLRGMPVPNAGNDQFTLVLT